MRKKGFVIIGIIAFLGVVLPLVCGFLLLKRNQKMDLSKSAGAPSVSSTIIPSSTPITTPTPIPTTTPPTPTPTRVIPSPEPTVEIVNGWKVYKSEGEEVYYTDDWQFFSGKEGNIPHSFRYPADWILRGTVFDDAKGKKIAEFAPGPVELKGTQNCSEMYDSLIKDERVKVISKEETTMNGLGIFKIVTETLSESILWYPNIYCLQQGNNALLITFYERELNSANRILFDEIISTFEFE